MTENVSPNVLLDDESPENITLPKVQGKHEAPFSFPGSGTEEEYPFLTPEPKLALQKHDYPSYTTDIFLSSSSGSSDTSRKEVPDTFSSSSSSDDESGTYDQNVNGNEALQPKVIEFDIGSSPMEDNLNIVKDEAENMLEKKKDVLYEELLKKVVDYETELEFIKKKFQLSQEEIARLRYENLTLVEEFGNTIEKLRISEEKMGKIEQELRIEFEEHQHQLQGQLDLANQNINLLQTKLDSERSVVDELREMFNKTTNDLNHHGRQVEELKLALHDAEKDFSKERSLFQHEITSLNQEKLALEMSKNELQEHMKQYEIENIEAQKMQKARETELLKSLDTHKLRYDMVMAERDEVFAKMQTLAAELNSRNCTMLQKEEQITKLRSEHLELLAQLEETKKFVEELRIKVLAQEKEVEKQRVIIYDSANEKREAIRQLCFALEYYRNEYHELRSQVISKYKKPATLAV